MIPKASFQTQANFRPFQFGPESNPDRDIKLYHVYDDFSQTPYEEGYGISASIWSPVARNQRPCDVITGDSLYRHLNWANRHPTPYISLWGSWEAAAKDAERRVARPWVTVELPSDIAYVDADGNEKRASTGRRLRGQVHIATISLRELLHNTVFVFHLSQYTSAYDFPVKVEKIVRDYAGNFARTYIQTELKAVKPISPNEGLALYFVPDSAVTKVTTWRPSAYPTPPPPLLNLRGITPLPPLSPPAPVMNLNAQPSLRRRLRDLRLFATDYKYAQGHYITADGRIPVRWTHVRPLLRQSTPRTADLSAYLESLARSGTVVPHSVLLNIGTLWIRDEAREAKDTLWSLTKSIERLATKYDGSSLLASKDARLLGDRVYQGLLLLLTFGDPIWKYAVKPKQIKRFQDLVLQTYRQEILYPGAMWTRMHATSNSKIVRFTAWLVEQEVVSIENVESSRLPIDWNKDHQWVLTDHFGPKQ
ncbi:hypothetical protein B0T21DRAFT_71705 [Apiosordaria backusii]|uniref:DUF7587 domain-containing protein n=1 Tax=Apiosordaria backusii TaxID=314023 RepID=A0AA40AEM7_9PEZI|nr:hypothetical protein B0T21DRAFT_71705 [Apiosordaria backusii]